MAKSQSPDAKGPKEKNDVVGEEPTFDVEKAKEDLWAWIAKKYKGEDFTNTPEEAERKKKAAEQEKYQK